MSENANVQAAARNEPHDGSPWQKETCAEPNGPHEYKSGDPRGARPPLPCVGSTIRCIQPGDATALADLAGQLGYPTDAESFRRRLNLLRDPEQNAVFVAAIDETVIGWVHVFLRRLLVSEGEAEIGALIVSENNRKRGIGGALMQHAEDWARRRGCGGMRIRSNVKRNDAHAFYTGLGYQVAKTQSVFRKPISHSS